MTEVLSLSGFLITRDEWELWGEDDRRDILTALAATGEPGVARAKPERSPARSEATRSLGRGYGGGTPPIS